MRPDLATMELPPILSAAAFCAATAVEMNEGYLSAIKTETDANLAAEYAAAAAQIAASAGSPRASELAGECEEAALRLGPAYVSFGPYTMDASGLVVENEVGRGKARWTETVWISAPFEVLGQCRDPHGRAWGKMLRWRDADGREHVRHVADAALYGDPGALCASLADHGLWIDPARQRDLRGYFAAVRPKRRVRIPATTNESVLGQTACGDVTRGGGIPGAAMWRYAGRHD